MNRLLRLPGLPELPRLIRLNWLIGLVWLIGLAPAFAQAPRTMRLDFYHTGTATTEVFSLDRLVIEPTPWPGNPQKHIDDTNFGKYLFEVIDQASNRTIYSRGFASIFGEWETTAEAKRQTCTFQESLRFPLPAAPVQVVVKKRDAANAFKEVWSTLVDPADQRIDPVPPASPGPLVEASGLQCVGTVSASGRFRHLAAVHGQASPVAHRRDLRCFRLRTLCADVRQPAVP